MKLSQKYSKENIGIFIFIFVSKNISAQNLIVIER